MVYFLHKLHHRMLHRRTSTARDGGELTCVGATAAWRGRPQRREVKRGDGAHLKLAFEVGKARGLFNDGDSIVCIHSMRNSAGSKQFMVRILAVTSDAMTILGRVPRASVEDNGVAPSPPTQINRG